jgi:type II secretory pathway component PulF
MPVYRFKAYDKEGLENSGVLNSEDTMSARSELKKRGLVPFELELDSGDDGGLFQSSSMTLTEQARFSRQIAALLKGGVPLSKALSSLEGQQAWESRRSIFVELREELERGKGFSEALIEKGKMFSPTLISIVRVGESTGRLDYSFRQLAKSLEREIDHRRRLISAIAYPAITAVISIGVLAFLMVYLVPTVARMFADVQGDLPLITQIIIGVSNFFRDYWKFVGAGAIGFALLFHFGMKISSFKRKCQLFELKIPIWGKFVQGMKMEAWSRNMGMMIECGVTLMEAIKVMGENETSILLKEALEKVEKSLERGAPFSDSLKNTGHFPLFLIQMIEAGEASGELAPMLESSAAELEAENRVITELFLNILEPTLIVVMGVFVGAIMIGVLLPIYEMNRFL